VVQVIGEEVLQQEMRFPVSWTHEGIIQRWHISVCVCVSARARARVCACVHACMHALTHTHTSCMNLIKNLSFHFKSILMLWIFIKIQKKNNLLLLEVNSFTTVLFTGEM
jgi:hypothetical protein